MKRWHNELPLMERQRKMDLESHRKSARRSGREPDDFECVCKVARGIFRKKKQWACSCHMCRAASEDKKRTPKPSDMRRLKSAEDSLNEAQPVVTYTQWFSCILRFDPDNYAKQQTEKAEDAEQKPPVERSGLK